MFQKQSKDKYDFILGRDLLQDIGLDIHYSTSQFVWDNIIVNMVPYGFWTSQKIKNVATTWRNQNSKTAETKINEELHLAEIKPADYKPTNIGSNTTANSPNFWRTWPAALSTVGFSRSL